MSSDWTPVPQLGFGQVVHARTRPARHQFRYGTYFLLLPMRARAAAPVASAWQPNKAGALSFHDEDHGAGATPAQGGALPWLLQLLQAQGVADTGGDIWLQSYPRVWGYSFKPVSFWYCFEGAADGALRAVVAEVNNTFGERHCYVLRSPLWGERVEADKQFHVSPFCEVQGHYAFCFEREMRDGIPTLSARVDYHDADGLLLHTCIAGALQPLDAQARRRALWNYPLMTLGVVWHIHRQAFALWRKHVPYFSKPEPPAMAATANRLT